MLAGRIFLYGLQTTPEVCFQDDIVLEVDRAVTIEIGVGPFRIGVPKLGFQDNVVFETHKSNPMSIPFLKLPQRIFGLRPFILSMMETAASVARSLT